MKKFFYIIMIVGAAVMLQSCDQKIKEEAIPEGSVSENSIIIGNTNVAETNVKSAQAVTTESAVVAGDDFSFTITETVEPMQATNTKGDYTGLTDITALQTNGFALDGYYKTANMPAFTKYINAAEVTYNNSKWGVAGDPRWREKSYHYFWAYAPVANVSNFTGDPVSEIATFSYTSDFNHDLVIAQNEKYWDWETVCAQDAHTGDKIDFTGDHAFDHALSGVKVNYNFISKAVMKQDGSSIQPAANRLTITSIDIATKNGGVCTVNPDNTFAWTPGAGALVKHTHAITETETGSEATQVNLTGVSNGASFEIPQDAMGIIAINIRDIKKKLTYPKTFDLRNIFSNGSQQKTDKKWAAGDMYTYNLSGTIVASYQPKNIDGIKFNFSGKDLRDTLLLSNVDGAHISKLKISWEGVASGNGSCDNLIGVVLMPHKNYTGTKNLLKIDTDFPSIKNAGTLNTGTNYPGVVWAALVPGSGKANPIYRGSITDSKDKDGKPTEYTNSFCSTGEIILPSNITGAFDIFVAYVGGNNSGRPNWKANNFSVEIIEYK